MAKASPDSYVSGDHARARPSPRKWRTGPNFGAPHAKAVRPASFVPYDY